MTQENESNNTTYTVTQQVDLGQIRDKKRNNQYAMSEEQRRRVKEEYGINVPKGGYLSMGHKPQGADVYEVVMLDSDGRSAGQRGRPIYKGLVDLVKMDPAFMMDVSDGFGENVLHHAAREKSGRSASQVVENYPPQARKLMTLPNKDGDTPLHIAVSSGNAEAVRALGQGVPELGGVEWKNRRGFTPLHEAVSSGNVETVRLLATLAPNLLDVGNTKGQSPLEMAREQAAASSSLGRYLSPSRQKTLDGIVEVLEEARTRATQTKQQNGPAQATSTDQALKEATDKYRDKNYVPKMAEDQQSQVTAFSGPAKSRDDKGPAVVG